MSKIISIEGEFGPALIQTASIHSVERNKDGGTRIFMVPQPNLVHTVFNLKEPFERFTARILEEQE